MCGVVTDAAGSLLDAGAKKANAKAQQAIFNNDLGQQDQNFNTRLNDVKASDQKLLTLDDANFNTDQITNQQGYDYLLNNKGQAFDNQVGYDKALSTAQTGAQTGLITANKQVRLDQQALLDAERARQAGFQAQADTAGQGLVANSGQPAFDANRAADTTARNNFTTANTANVPPPMQFSTDGAVQKDYARELASRVGQANTNAQNANAVSGYTDALNDGSRNIAGFRQAIDGLSTDARLSESALPAEFGVGDAQRQTAGDVASFLTNQAQRQYAGDTATNSAYHDALGSARSAYTTQRLGANDAYYGGLTGAETAHINSLIDASKAYQAALTNLANYKMGNTTSYSPLGTGLHIAYKAGQAIGQVFSGGG